MYRDSIYNRMLSDENIFKNNGYDYKKNGIVKRFFSSRMRMNPMMDEFLMQIEPYFIEILNSVKKLQFYQNYTLDKNDDSINI